MSRAEWFWDMLSSRFDKLSESLETTHGRSIEKTKAYLNAGHTVLDYGCATGIIACELAGDVKEIHGIDISSKMIEAAQRKAGERQVENVKFAHVTIFDESLKKESFDVILAFGVLLYLKDVHKAMQRINELLKPGGVLISITACMGEAKASIRIPFSVLTKTGIFFPYMKFFRFSELEDVIADGKFQIIETESYQDNPITYFISAKRTQTENGVPV